jgi:hypothetical protein
MKDGKAIKSRGIKRRQHAVLQLKYVFSNKMFRWKEMKKERKRR